MIPYIGDFRTGVTVRYWWGAFASSGASITRGTDGSIRVYKNGSTTQRASSSGITDTEDFDGVTGLNVLSLDLSDNDDAGFYAAGNDYAVVLVGAVIDSQTVNAPLFQFSIENRTPTVDTVKVAGTTQTAGDIAALITTVDDLLDTEVAAIKAKTDNLPTDPADASVIAGRFDDVDTAIAAIATGASAPVLHEGAYVLKEDQNFPDGTVDVFVGDTRTLVLNLKDSDGDPINLGTATVAVAQYTLAGTLVSSLAATVTSAADGIVRRVIPSAWTATAGTYRLYATVTGVDTVICGPLPMLVRPL